MYNWALLIDCLCVYCFCVNFCELWFSVERPFAPFSRHLCRFTHGGQRCVYSDFNFGECFHSLAGCAYLAWPGENIPELRPFISSFNSVSKCIPSVHPHCYPSDNLISYYLLIKGFVFRVASWRLDGEIDYWAGLKLVDENHRWTDATKLTDRSDKYNSLLTQHGQCLHFKWDNRFIPSAGSCTERKMYICKREGTVYHLQLYP